jgi:hypothetical protein
MELVLSLVLLVRRILENQRKLRKERLINLVSWKRELNKYINRTAEIEI